MHSPKIVQLNSRDAWLAERRSGLGASEIAAVLGVSPWASPLDVYLIKRGLVVVPDNPAMARGRRFEPMVAEMYEEERGETLVVPPAHALYRDTSEPWATCTPDRFRQDGRIVEIKTANYAQVHRWGEPGSNDVPDEYALQVMWQMRVCDRDVADIAVLLFLREPELRVYTVERDLELEADIVERARAFWFDHVVAGVPPEMSGSEAASAWLKRRFPREQSGQIIDAPHEVVTAMAKLRAVRETAATLEGEDDRLVNVVKEAIGEHAGIQAPGVGTITWRASKDRRKVEWERLAREMIARDALAEALPRYTTQTEGARVFRPRWEAAGGNVSGESLEQ